MPRQPKQSGSKRIRALDTLDRRPGQRPPRARILIVCEGEKTEPNYFQAIRKEFRLTSIYIRSEGDPILYAIEAARKPMEWDEVWCVLDVENPVDRPNLAARIEQAHRIGGLQLAMSNPAFEFWFLLHFWFTTKPFADAAEVIAELVKHVPDYEKNYRKCEKFMALTEQAITNARRVLEGHVGDDVTPNPSTQVHSLVEKLKNMSAALQG